MDDTHVFSTVHGHKNNIPLHATTIKYGSSHQSKFVLSRSGVSLYMNLNYVLSFSDYYILPSIPLAPPHLSSNNKKLMTEYIEKSSTHVSDVQRQAQIACLLSCRIN